jgi:Flp pilus assembly protein TadG
MKTLRFRDGIPKRPRRRGSAAVEFAVIAPLMLMTTFALIEFSRAFMVMGSLEDAAAAGCRAAILERTSQTKVETAVANSLSSSGISNFDVTITPSTFETATEWEPITVVVTADASDVAWGPSTFLSGIKFSGSSTQPRETGEDSANSDWNGDIKK